MIAPRIPENEEYRLSELKKYNILDTIPEKMYDDIAFLASQVCDTSMALINFIDEDRQWTKANFGYPAGDLPRNVSFCSLAICEKDFFLEVEDTSLDDRFEGNPLITSDPFIRFYAGAALVSASGLPLGTLCVIDQKPKKLSTDQKETLRILSRQIMSLLELRSKHDELESVKKVLEIASRAREDFFSNISHEIRTPLNSIIGIANILLEGNPREDQLDEINLLKFSSDSLLFLINDLLDLGKMNAGKLVIENQDFNLKDLLSTIIRSFSQKAEDKGVEVTFEYDEELPEILIGDPNRMAQIFNNLLSNAYKFTQNGTVTVRVKHTGFQKEKVGIHFMVEDTGIGIKPENLESVFESFTQDSEDTSRLYGGTGLGLSITRNLVALMDGELTVESTFGVGTRFSFELSLSLGNPLKFQSSHAVPAKNFVNLGDYNIRLLVVEDNPANQMVVGKFLKKWGIDHEFAENGQIAVEMTKKEMYDAILMDLHMPVLNGYEAARQIRNLEGKYFSEVPIIALTASALLDVKSKIMDIGMNDYVTKPFKPDELYEKITQHTISREALSQINEISAERFRPILEELAEGDRDFVSELSGLYILNYEELSAKIEDLIYQKKMEEYRDAVHKIKTSNQTLGLINFEYHLGRIKNRMVNYSPERSLENIRLIRSICESIIVELRKLADLKPGTEQ